MCIANCLGLTDVGPGRKNRNAEYCNFNPLSGLATGKECTKTFYFDEKNNKVVLCSIWMNPDGKFPLVFNFSVMNLLKSRECTHISISPILIFNHMTNNMVENLPPIEEVREVIRLGSTYKTKILLEVGSWDDYTMSPESLSKVAANQTLTSKFSNEVRQFIEKYSLHGLLLNWQYPTCPKHACIPGVPKDRTNIVSLIQSLKSALPPSQNLLLLSLPPYSDALRGFNFPALEPFVDLFAIYSFNYGMSGGTVVKQNSPLLDQKAIVEAIVEKNGSLSKLLVGISTIIEDCILTDKKYNKVGAPQKTNRVGWFPYGEACRRVRNGSYTIVRDAVASNYATLNTDWFSFEDYNSLERKVDYVKRNRIAGMWIFHAHGDDSANDCGCGSRPLTRMVAELLRAEGGCTYTNCP